MQPVFAYHLLYANVSFGQAGEMGKLDRFLAPMEFTYSKEMDV